MRQILFFLATLCSTYISATSLQVHITATPHQHTLLQLRRALLERYESGRYVEVDSIAFAGDTIAYDVPPDGTLFYRLSMPIVPSILFIIAPNEPVVDISGTFEQLLSNTIGFKHSDENLCYLSATRARNDFETEFRKNIFISKPDNQRAKLAAADLIRVATVLQTKLLELSAQYPHTFAAKHILPLLKIPVYPAPNGEHDAMSWYQQHFLDSASYQDSMLTRYPNIMTNTSLYETTYNSTSMCTPIMLDHIFHRDMDTRVANQLRDRYINKYRSFGMPKCIISLLAHTEHIPIDSLTPSGRLAYQIQHIRAGNPVPLLTLPSPNGKLLALKDIASSSPYTLVVIYSHDCGHCLETLPLIKAMSDSIPKSKLAIYAVDIHPDYMGWKQFITDAKYGFTDVFLPEAEKNKVLDQYAMMGTPILVLMNRKLQVLSRWEGLADIRKLIK
jgi:thiol-disulfide isomerase/thioredoxin